LPPFNGTAETSSRKIGRKMMRSSPEIAREMIEYTPEIGRMVPKQ